MTGTRKRLAVGAAALLLIGLLPVDAAVAAPAETTVRGSVTAGGHALAGVRVGTWSPQRGRVATTVTDAQGSFALRSPSDLPVDVWAGVDPSTSRAVFAAGDRHLVRGVIGAARPGGVAEALWQRVTAAAPAVLGRRPLRFRLQEAGRFSATAPEGGTGRIALVRGGTAASVGRVRDGAVDSGWLVPGAYRVRWEAGPGRLPAERVVRVVPGSASVVAPRLAVSTTLTVRVTCRGRAVGAGVPIVRSSAQQDEAAGSTDSSGVVTLRGLRPGTRRYVVGRYATDTTDASPAEPPTSDRHLPSAPITVTTRPGQRTAELAVDLEPASVITGRVTARPHHPVIVVAEDAHGDPVRSTTASGGAFALGGLPAGAYRVVAEDRDARTFATATATVAEGTTTAVAAVLAPHLPDPVVAGRLQGAGTVRLRAAADPRILARDGDAGADGRFRIAVLPGRFVPIAFVTGRSQSTGRPVEVAASTTLHLPDAPRTAALRGLSRIRGTAVPVAPQVRGPRIPNEDLQGPRYTDTSSLSIDGGRWSGSHLPPGAYRFAGIDAPLPAEDGPWSYRLAPRSFRLTAGRTTDLGVVAVGVAG